MFLSKCSLYRFVRVHRCSEFMFNPTIPERKHFKDTSFNIEGLYCHVIYQLVLYIYMFMADQESIVD